MADDITDGIADAIIGAVFLFHKVTKATAGAYDATTSVMHGRGLPIDVTPKPGTKPFQMDPRDADIKRAPVHRLPSSQRRPMNDAQTTEQYRQQSAQEDPGTN